MVSSTTLLLCCSMISILVRSRIRSLYVGIKPGRAIILSNSATCILGMWVVESNEICLFVYQLSLIA